MLRLCPSAWRSLQGQDQPEGDYVAEGDLCHAVGYHTAHEAGERINGTQWLAALAHACPVGAASP